MLVTLLVLGELMLLECPISVKFFSIFLLHIEGKVLLKPIRWVSHRQLPSIQILLLSVDDVTK